MELQGRADELRAAGLGLAAISYDPVETLKAFADRHAITFPLLSDAGSEIIRRYGILNTTVKPGARDDGVPFPGTFVLDASGRVVRRFFEMAYQYRNTAASIALELESTGFTPQSAGSLDHDYLAARLGSSDSVVAPGTRFSLVLDIQPKPGLHVYAPGTHEYQVVRLALDDQPIFVAHDVVYPPAEEYYFAPLDERVPVYQKPFRLVRDVTLLVTPETRELASKPDATLTITGTLDYQACDDEICYPPQSVPVKWTIGLKGLEPSR